MTKLRRRTISRLDAYIQTRGGIYVSPTNERHLTKKTVTDVVPQAALRGPGTVLISEDGQERLYTFNTFSQEKAERRLILIRIADDERDWMRRRVTMDYVNPYDDPALESVITVERSIPSRGYQFECAVCGRLMFFSGYYPEAKQGARMRGWHDTYARGWTCPEHHRIKTSGIMSRPAILQRQLAAALDTFEQLGVEPPDEMRGLYLHADETSSPDTEQLG